MRQHTHTLYKISASIAKLSASIAKGCPQVDRTSNFLARSNSPQETSLTVNLACLRFFSARQKIAERSFSKAPIARTLRPLAFVKLLAKSGNALSNGKWTTSR
jgi:hypothetical protein